MVRIFAALLFAICASQSHAELTCEGSYSGNNVKITLNENQVKLERNGQVTLLTGLKNVWDGHFMGMFTAEGFSMVYEDHFGRYKNVSVTAFFNLNGTTSPSHIASFDVDCVDVE